MSETEGVPKGPKGSVESRLEDIIEDMTAQQLDFIAARRYHPTDKATAEAVGVTARQVKRWKKRGVRIDEAVRLMALDGVIIASEVLRRNLVRAAMVKVEGLEFKDDERLRQQVASEIIERGLGKVGEPPLADIEIIVGIDLSRI